MRCSLQAQLPLRARTGATVHGIPTSQGKSARHMHVCLSCGVFIYTMYIPAVYTSHTKHISGMFGDMFAFGFPPHTRRTHTPLTPDTAGQHMDIFKRQLEIP